MANWSKEYANGEMKMLMELSIYHFVFDILKLLSLCQRFKKFLDKMKVPAFQGYYWGSIERKIHIPAIHRPWGSCEFKLRQGSQLHS